jgi:hypothetical protein
LPSPSPSSLAVDVAIATAAVFVVVAATAAVSAVAGCLWSILAWRPTRKPVDWEGKAAESKTMSAHWLLRLVYLQIMRMSLEQ